MTKKKIAKRNPQDVTRRNVQTDNRRLEMFESEFDGKLEDIQKIIDPLIDRVAALEERRQDVSIGVFTVDEAKSVIERLQALEERTGVGSSHAKEVADLGAGRSV